jgi:hypothetical protein
MSLTGGGRLSRVNLDWECPFRRKPIFVIPGST